MIVKLRGKEAEVVWHKGGEVSLRYTDKHNGYNVVADDDPDLDWLGQQSVDTKPKEDIQKLSDDELREKLLAIRQGRISASKNRSKKPKPKKDIEIASIIAEKQIKKQEDTIAELLAQARENMRKEQEEDANENV